MSKELNSTEIKVSLVIQVHEELASIANLLERIGAQTRQPDEIVIVDRGSRDGTLEFLREVRTNNPKVRLIEASRASPGLGRNIGIANGHFDWIGIIDSENPPDPRWLDRLIDVVVGQSDVDAVCGSVEPEITSFLTECASMAYVPAKQRTAKGIIQGPFILSFLVSREAWHSVGGFLDMQAFAELVFLEELKDSGLTVALAPGAIVYPRLPSSIKSTFRRFALFSKCIVWANKQRHWNYGLAGFYSLSIPFLFMAAAHRFWWLGIPALALFARVVKKIWQHHETRATFLVNPFRFAGVLAIVLIVDLATFVGWVEALLQFREARRISDLLIIMRGE